jgi:hypothetical protein
MGIETILFVFVLIIAIAIYAGVKKAKGKTGSRPKSDRDDRH